MSSETPDKKLDRVTDEIVAMVDDWHRNDGWDEANAKTQIRRMLRDECSELWQQSADEVGIERLEKENADLRRQLDAAQRDHKAMEYVRQHNIELVRDSGRSEWIASVFPFVRKSRHTDPAAAILAAKGASEGK